MGQHLSAGGAEGSQHHGERCTTGYNGSVLETSIPVTAWRRAQLQNSREMQLENSRSSTAAGENGSGNNGDSGIKSGTNNPSKKRSAISGRGVEDNNTMSPRYPSNPSSRNYPASGLGSGPVGAGGSSDNSCSNDGSIDIGSGSGRNSSSSADGDIGRMSVRAAIDSFIENCLSARSDPPTGLQVNLSSITGIGHNSNSNSNNYDKYNSSSNGDSKTSGNGNASGSPSRGNATKNSGGDKDGAGEDKDRKSDENCKKDNDVKSTEDEKTSSKDGGEGDEKKDSVSSKNGDLEKDSGFGESSSKKDCGDDKVDQSENKSDSDHVSHAAANGDESERVNENDSVLVIDCGNEDTENDDKNNNNKDKKSDSSSKNNSSSSDALKDSSESKGAAWPSRQSPVATASPHVIDVDSEEFPSPPGVLFPHGRKLPSDSKSGSPVNHNNKGPPPLPQSASSSSSNTHSNSNNNNSSFENYKQQLEKKTFSDFLQDRLMAQIESNELSKKGSSNILTWEVSNTNSSTTNNPPARSTAGKGASSPTMTGGPVRLQTLIEKVLDQSLNSDPRPPLRAGITKPSGISSSASIALPNTAGSSSSSTSSPTITPASVTGYINKPEGPTRVKISTVCFKDHIEKVLEESFRSYEEEEENEELNLKRNSQTPNSKGEGNNKSSSEGHKSPDVEIIKESSASSGYDNQQRKKMESNGSRVGPDGTIRVKDIVDRVISQAEVISKLLTPGQEQNRSGNSSAGQDNSHRMNSSMSSGPGGNINMPNSHMQKSQGKPSSKPDHLSSGGPGSHSSRPGPTGRKRGRPRLGSPNRSTSKNSDKGGNNSDSRNHLLQQRGGYPTQGMPGQNSSSSEVRARLGQGPPPLDYVPPQRLPGMPPLVGPQGPMPSYHQNHHQHHSPSSSHHHPQQQQHSSSSYYNSVPPHPSSLSSGPHSNPNSSSSAPYPASHPHHRNYHGGLPPPPTSSQSSSSHPPPTSHPGHHHGPPPPPHHSSHHHPHHPHPQQHRPGTSPPPPPPPPSSSIHKRHPDHNTGPDGKPLPLLVMTDHHSGGAPNSNSGSSSSSSHHHHPHNSPSPRYVTMSHTPTPSCPCEVCVDTFSSRNRSPSHHHQHPHHHRSDHRSSSNSSSGSNVPPPPQQQPPTSSASYPPTSSHQSSSSKPYIQRRGDDHHPSHPHPHHYHPYQQQQQYQNNAARRSSVTSNPGDLSKEALKPVIPANNGGKQFPTQAIIPSYVAQRPHPDSLSPGAAAYPTPDHPDDDRHRRRSSFTDSSRPPHHHSPHYPPQPPPHSQQQQQQHHPHPHHRTSSNMPEDNIPNNYRQEADRPSNLRPVDLHKASPGSYRSSQFTPPAAPSASAPASSPPMGGGDDLPLDLSVKPTAAPAHEKKARPEESPYGERRMSHNDVDPRDRHSGQAAYPIQSLEDSMERNLPYQQQPSYPHQNYYHHSTSLSSTSSSAKLPSPALPPQHGSNDGPPPPPPHQQHHSSSNPEGKYYPGLHHTSPSSSSSSSLPYPHPKHVESPTGQPHPHPHNTSYPQQYQSPHGYNNNSSNNNNNNINTTTPPNRGSSSSPANSSLLSLPPHLRRNSGNSSSGGEHPSQDNAKSYYRQGGSPYSDSNHQPIKPDMDLPMPRLYQPPRNLEDCPPHPSSRPPIPPPDNKNGDYPSQNPPHHQQQQQQQQQRQPPPLMKPATQPPPPSPQQQQQSGGTNPNSNPSNPNSNPDDQDNLKHISRHEPIQNIIGNHPQNDILYLICKLCRQTYGSPYGFRKHFRNQHGFEPKVEHTIVQTISATKTAMGHNNIPEGGGGFDESKYRHSEDGNGNPIPYPLDQAIKLEIPDNYTMDEFNSSQLAAYNRAQEHVKIIFKQSAAGEDGSGNMENAKVLECPECGQTFQLNDFGSYKRHCRQHSMVPNAGPFSCHDCHRSFAEPGQLEQHLNTHNTFTPSVCGICRTFFSSPHYLAEHLQAAHGHVLPSEMSKNSATNRLEPPAGENSVSTVKQEKPSPDMPQVFQTMDLQSRIERALMLENDLENATNANSDAHRSSSRSPVDSRSSSNNNNASSSSVAPKRLSPSLASLPPTKRHRMSTSNSCSPPSAASMLTVVTPKQLDIQKRPADPVVASASPDSSFDDRPKLTTSKATTTTSITSAAAASSDAGNSAASNNSSNTNSPIPSRDANTTPIPSGRRSGDSTKSSTKSPSLADMKSYITGKGGNESDRCASVESSNSDSNQSASVASSPGLVDESQMYYKHKKYSRHLKRRLSNDTNNSSSGGTGAAAGGAEPSTPTSDSKMPKLDSCDTNSISSRSGEKDGKSTPPTLSSSTSSSTSSSAVTSSVNASVRKEDCQSSSSISSSSKSSHSKGSKSGSRNSSRSSTPNSSKEDKDSMKSSDKPHAKDKSDKAKNKDNDSKKKSECKV